MDADLLDVTPFDWYSIVSADRALEQGDILLNFPIPVLPPSLVDVPQQPSAQVALNATVERFDVIVMSQSCDLPKLAINDEVILCPLLDYFTVATYSSQDKWKQLIAGRIVSAHLLNQCIIAGYEFNYQVVNLRRVFAVAFGLVQRFAARQNRIRLLPPYREHLAQAFARQFMRIGLPIHLPDTKPDPLHLAPVDGAFRVPTAAREPNTAVSTVTPLDTASSA